MKLIIDGKETDTTLIRRGHVKIHKVNEVYYNNGNYVLYNTNLMTGKKESVSLREEDLMNNNIQPLVLQPGVILTTRSGGREFIQHSVYHHSQKTSENFELLTAFPSVMPQTYAKLESIHSSRVLNATDTHMPGNYLMNQKQAIIQAAQTFFQAIDTDLKNIKEGHLIPAHIPETWFDEYAIENNKYHKPTTPVNEAKEISLIKMLGAYFCTHKGFSKNGDKIARQIRAFFTVKGQDYNTYYATNPNFRKAVRYLAGALRTHIETSPRYAVQDRALLMTFVTRRESLFIPLKQSTHIPVQNNQKER